MWLIILPYVDPGIRYEWCMMKNMTIYVKDVLYVIAIVLAVSELYKFTFYKDNVLTVYFRSTERI